MLTFAAYIRADKWQNIKSLIHSSVFAVMFYIFERPQKKNAYLKKQETEYQSSYSHVHTASTWREIKPAVP